MAVTAEAEAVHGRPISTCACVTRAPDLTCLCTAGTDSEDVELPWWTYGSRGMQLWFPSALSEPLTPGYQPALSQDPELEFDHEVYPVGVSLADVSVIGTLALFAVPCVLRTMLGSTTLLWDRRLDTHTGCRAQHFGRRRVILLSL